MKSLAVTTSGDAGVAVIAAHAGRGSVDATSTAVTAHVRNVTDAGVCFLEAASLTYQDASNATVLTNGATYVHGSVGLVSAQNNISTETCLAPGEDGYFVNLIFDSAAPQAFARVASVSWAWRGSSWDGMRPQARLRPTGYSVNKHLVGGTVDLRNLGAAAARFGSVSALVVLLDDQDRGLGWSYATLPSGSSLTRLDPGATVPLSMVLSYSGRSTSLFAGASYEDCNGCLMVAPDLSSDESIWRYHQARDEDEDLKRRRFAP